MAITNLKRLSCSVNPYFPLFLVSILCASPGRFSMVCRDAHTHCARKVNPLVCTTPEEKALHDLGKRASYPPSFPYLKMTSPLPSRQTTPHSPRPNLTLPRAPQLSRSSRAARRTPEARTRHHGTYEIGLGQGPRVDGGHDIGGE